jgi:hypothetical protein
MTSKLEGIQEERVVGTTHSESSTSQSQASNQPMLGNGGINSRCYAKPTTIWTETCFLLGPTQGYIRRHSDRNIQSSVETTDPSSRQRERPTSTSLQLS